MTPERSSVKGIEREVVLQVVSIMGSGELSGLQCLQAKDGAYVYRLRHRGRPLVAKYYVDVASSREIPNYALLQSLGIPTLAVLGASERCLCLEDLEYSEAYRRGTPEDLQSEEIARHLATWYRRLHDRGRQALGLERLYREADVIAAESMRVLCSVIPEAAETWDYVERHLDDLLARLGTLEETLTYNDFYWTNLAVARHTPQALMFDYNLLGRGYRYADLRNVCSSLAPPAAAAFLDAYGALNLEEVVVDETISPLVNLIFASARPAFPAWAEGSREAARDGTLLYRLRRLVGGC